MTPRLWILPAIVLAAGGALSSASSGSSRSQPCGPNGAKTLAASKAARVYVVQRTVYGCTNTAVLRFRLGVQGSCNGAPEVEAARVTGVLAGYGLRRCGIDTGNANVVLRRLTDGKTLLNTPATTKPLGPESYQSVGSVAVKADGAIAWIGVGSSLAAHGTDNEVRRVQSSGSSLLDTGSVIDPGSLRLQGSTLTWKHGRMMRSATLH